MDEIKLALSKGYGAGAPSDALRVGRLMASLVALSALYIPLVILVSRSVVGAEGHFSFEWYRAVLSDSRLMEAVFRSLRLALGTAAVSAVLGGMGALSFYEAERVGARRRLRSLRQGLEVLLYIPMVLPELVLGVALLAWLSWLGVGVGEWAVLAAHVTFAVSYVFFTVLGRRRELDPALEDAASDLGASRWDRFWKVRIPLLLPAVLSGSALAFSLSFDDFLLSFFLSGPGEETLPVQVYTAIRYGVSPKIQAVSTLLMIFALGIAWISRRAGSRSKLSVR